MSEASASPKSAYFWWVPETDRFVAYGYTALGQQIFNISMAEIEFVI